MALDGVTIAHLISELTPQLVGARIDKVQQPEKEEIHLVLRQQNQSLRLLLNASATLARFHLTREAKKNPLTPPMFCMILRKYLEGGKITSIEQIDLERTVTFVIQNYNEYGDLSTLHLHLEIMGKHSNLLLVDPQTNLILDGLKRYSHALSRHREVLPGRKYIAPPSQGKLTPIRDEEIWRSILLQEELEREVCHILMYRFAGVSPELAREITIQAGLDAGVQLNQCGDIDLSRLFQAYSRLANPQALAKLEPCLYHDASGNVTAFSFIPFKQYLGLATVQKNSLNEAVSDFYLSKTAKNTLESKRGSLRKLVLDEKVHLNKKLDIYEDTLANAQKGMLYQKWGELITANLYRIKPGMKEVTVEDYYDPEFAKLTIPLDPALNGIENSQRYYRLYNKAKAALHKTEPLKQSTLDELKYLDSLLLSLDQASSPEELDEIHQELIEQGYVAGKHTGKTGKNKKAKPEAPKPKVYRSSQGRLILVGKNNRQNDWLTLKYAKPNDLWLHVKNMPGSHVLIPLEENEEFPDDQTLEEAAALAIYFSQARGSSLVPVDYTHVKNIKKPNAAKPGMVIYDKNWSLYLTPEPEVIKRLLESEHLS